MHFDTIRCATILLRRVPTISHSQERNHCEISDRHDIPNMNQSKEPMNKKHARKKQSMYTHHIGFASADSSLLNASQGVKYAGPLNIGSGIQTSTYVYHGEAVLRIEGYTYFRPLKLVMILLYSRGLQNVWLQIVSLYLPYDPNLLKEI